MPNLTNTAVVVLTSDYKISGSIDLMPGSRLTDYITSARNYFAVTEVEVENVRTGKIMFRGKFVDINRDAVVMILPAENYEDCRCCSKG